VVHQDEGAATRASGAPRLAPSIGANWLMKPRHEEEIVMGHLTARRSASCFWSVACTAALVVWLSPAMAWAELPPPVVKADIPVGNYQIVHADSGAEILMDGFGSLLVPGKPKLPARIYAVAIPPGAEPTAVICDPGEGVILPGTFQIQPAPMPRVLGDENPALYSANQAAYLANYRETYGSDTAYPAQMAELVRRAGYRRYNLADVRVCPFQYYPQSGQVVYYPDLTVEVVYAPSPERAEVSPLTSERTEATARRLIVNYDEIGNWYPTQMVDTRLGRDYVVITLGSLISSIQPLVNWEQAKGRNVYVATVSYIDQYGTGFDLEEKIRNYLRVNYPYSAWGIEDVLLVGNYSDLPLRETAQDLGYGRPETDFYYAELSLPDDQSWDANGNRQWGENSDPIDMYSEIKVGRIPWSDPATVQAICQKSVAYEQNTDPAYKQNILLLGSYFWADTDNAVLMEAKVNQPWMAGWTMTRMYEQNSGYWSTYPCDYPLVHSNVMAVWPTGQYAFVNWAGHGSPTSCHIAGLGAPAFISSSDCPQLDDNHPAIIFADACSNSDTHSLNIGQAMLKEGAVGFVGATRVALGCPGWNDPSDGSSQSLDYFFTTCVTSGNYTQGGALQWGLTEMYQQGLWNDSYYETFEWGALWGNPDLRMVAPPALTIDFPSGLPELVGPGDPTVIEVLVKDGMETYVPGTGMLYYRFNGGTFQPIPLTHVSGQLYEAVLPPAGCSDVPEFYFSADGDGGTTIMNPATAPANCYTTEVGTVTVLIYDSFENNNGWTAVNLGATSGFWERGVPVNDPSWDYDPATDSDGSGQCFVTQNQMGNTDVDDGAVQLISPVYDMSVGNITISYDYYLYLTNTSGGVDRLLVEINSNGGTGTWTEIARHDSSGGLDWHHHEITQADLNAAGVTMTANMVLRFTANDANPQSIVEAGIDAFSLSVFECDEPDWCMGDANCSGGSPDFGDIEFFVAALSGETAWADYHKTHGQMFDPPPCSYQINDLNGGGVEFTDIQPFVQHLGGPCDPMP
jgi:hypothetical protein